MPFVHPAYAHLSADAFATTGVSTRRAREQRRHALAPPRRRDRDGGAGGPPTMPPSTKRSTTAPTRAAVAGDTAFASTKMPANGGSDSASSSAACGGTTEKTTSLRATSAATVPASVKPASARAASPRSAPSDAQSTSCPAACSAAPIAAPISPGWRRPTIMRRRERHRLAEQRRACGRRLGDDAAAPDHPAPRRMQPQHLERARRVVDDEVGGLALLDPVLVLDAERARAALGRAAEHLRDLLEPAHVREVQRERRGLDHVGAADRVPRIHDHVVAERDVDAGREQLLQLREAAPLRIDVEPALDERVRVRVDDDVDAGALQEAVQLRRVVRLVRAHRGAVATR